MIQTKGLSKSYKGQRGVIEVLKNINLVVKKGEMIGVIGESGAGKSTLLNILGLLDKPTSGQYYIEGAICNDFSDKKKSLYRNSLFGFIIQDYALVEKYTVRENLSLPFLYRKGKKVQNAEEKIRAVLDDFGILDKKDELAANLSGGQRQRVAIARSIINDPEIILADEPTAALDSKNSEYVLNVLDDLKASGKTIILVTHDMSVAGRCDRIIEMENGELTYL
ncbi:ATP-binding cassette domain-containing protein [Bacillus coagulans]|nr:ATP-binding cassette domain-containing protein [Heyndrickxia coagulans]